ncbi:MAG: nitronate monooxygenase [Desulfobacteraceae bacterium]|nr:nitronate monooxygenase [Desulfobacteraceae bacterium]
MGICISLSGLASAVANEGGVGVIAGAMPGIKEPDFGKNFRQANIRALKREIRKTRKQSNGVLGVNIMVALTNYADMVETSISEGVDIIFSGAGMPLDLPGFLKPGSQTKLAPIVSSARAVKLISKKWLARYDYLPDAVVVEGPKAGGHIGFKTNQIEDPEFCLEKLVAEVLKVLKPFESEYNKKIPVIAAGGIYTGHDIHRFMNMGASGVQLGTRFVATNECDADDAFKQSYVHAKQEDMAIIKSPVGMPGRALRNSFINAADQGHKTPFKCPFHCLKTCVPQKSPYCIALALGNAYKGKLKQGFAFAGENAYRVKDIISVKQLMTSLVEEFNFANAAPPV